MKNKLTAAEREQAIAYVNEQIAHGYHLVQYRDAAHMVDVYDCFPLAWWKDCHDRWIAAHP